MTREEARRKLDELNACIATSVQLIEANQETLDAFFAESASMASVGPILDPTLFNSSERRATEAILTPIYRVARDLVVAYHGQAEVAQAALAKVRG